MLSELRSLKTAQKVLLALVCLLGIGSAAVGYIDALNRSQDFQWSGEHILFQHVDPWLVYLQGNPGLQILRTENPVYLAHYYIMFAPLGFFAERHAAALWALLNITFAIVNAILIARFFRFPKWQCLLVVGLFLAATPTRNTIGNGQQGLFVMLFWSLSLLAAGLTRARSAIAGISYFKMNFALPTFVYLLLRGGLRAVAWSAVPAILGDILVWLWIRGVHNPRSLFDFAIEPLKVARTGYFPIGDSPNLMDVLYNLLSWFHVRAGLIDPTIVLSAVAVTVVVLYFATRQPGTSLQWQMALFGILSVSMFRHHPYDGVVLLFPVCYSLRFIQLRKAQISLFLLAFVWYLLRVLDATKIAVPYENVGVFLMLVAVLVLVYQLHGSERLVAPEWAVPSITA